LSDRLFDRVPVSFEVEYRTAGAFLVAYTANLSKGGLFIETPRPLAVGTELLLRFTVPDSDRIEVRGHVAWVRATPADGMLAGMGVEFEHLDARHGQVIDAVVAAFRGLTILLVATGAAARSLLTRAVLSVLSTAEVREVTTADAAEAALRDKPDLAIIDLDGGDTSECLYALRLAKVSHLPVLATSHDEGARARAQELGADETLPTPIVVADLQAAILRLLGRPSRVG
jgi:type IV pilus assembly protein PilZ